MSSGSEDNKPPVGGRDRLQLERLVLGQLSPDEVRQLESRLGAESLEEHKRSLEARSARFLEEYPPKRIVPRIEQRLAAAKESRRTGRPGRRISGHLAWAAPATAAALLLLAVSLGVFDSPERLPTPGIHDEETTRIKGQEPRLRIYRGRDGGPTGASEFERLTDGDVVRPGDVVQVGYVAAGRAYGVIVSIDGAGAVTLHAPEDPDHPERLQGEGEVLLEHGFRLDDAPSFERFFFVTGETPIPPLQIIESAGRLASDPTTALEQSLALPEGWEQTSLTLRKESQ